MNELIYSNIKVTTEFGFSRPWFEREKAQENFMQGILNESYAKSYVKSYNGYDVYLYQKRM